MATQTQESKNMRLISSHDLNGFGNIGEGISVRCLSRGVHLLRDVMDEFIAAPPDTRDSF